MRYATPPRGTRGFTLIELLVVMLLIGIILTFATLSLGDGGRGKLIDREARRLAALVELAGEDAVLSGRELGLYFDAAGYRFLTLDGETWR